MLRKGVFYVAFGWPYLLLALESARSVRRVNPGLPVAIATGPRYHDCLTNDQKALADHWLDIDLPPEQNRLVKTSADIYSPFDQTLMLDADTLAVADLAPMFNWLAHFDVAFKLNEARLGSAGNVDKGRSPVLDGSATVDDLPHWNGAVCLFRKSAASREFFATWNSRFRYWESPFDQVSLVDAIFLSSARVLSFDYRWNSPMKSFRNEKKAGDVVIVHYGSDIPSEVVAAARLDGSRLSNDREEAHQVLERFLSERVAARVAKDRFLEDAKRPRTTRSPVVVSTVFSRLRAALHRFRCMMQRSAGS